MDKKSFKVSKGSADFQTLLVHGPFQKLLLPFIFRGSVPLKVKSLDIFGIIPNSFFTESNENQLFRSFMNYLSKHKGAS